MDEQLEQLVGAGLLCIVLGVLGCVLPQRWNLFPLKRMFQLLLPEKASLLAARISGVLLVALGIALVTGAILRMFR